MPPSQTQPRPDFMQAVTAFQEGRVADAADACRAFLRDNPGHAACLHLLGSAEYALGRLDAAEENMKAAIAKRGDFPEMHRGLAQVLAAQGRPAEAAEGFARAIALKPEDAPAHYGLGLALKASGRVEEAARAFAQAVILKPGYLDALNALGILFCEQKMFAEAFDCFEAALAERPDFPEALNNLGVVCLEMGRYAEAATYCERALELKPDYVAAWTNRGNALRAQERWEEAIACYGKALILAPDSLEARNNIGLAVLHGLKNIELAESHFRQVLAQSPAHVPALTHLGIVASYRGAFDEAVALYEQALALQPDFIEAQNNLGNALRAMGRTSDAVETYARVVAAQPANADAHHNYALALLENGQYDEGWREFEWRWHTEQLAPGRRNFAQPQWRGEAAEGKTLLIHAEQGFGDTLQFCRFAPMAAAKGLRVIMEVQSELVRLLQTLPGVGKIIARGDSLPDFDLHCPMMSLPLAFSAREETIPSDAYLSANPEDVETWKSRMPDDGKRKIGLVWAGNPRRFSVELSVTDGRRSIAPELLAPLAEIKSAHFFSLQKGKTPPDALVMTDFMPQCRDFADTAALIANLDLVISVDTAVAHLASALGKPVWLLNRSDTCWRWLRGCDDSPWYPALRQFRQTQPGDWQSVVARVVEELKRTA
ncbi:MAG: tetratricopeptide repeat protein [Alphaproteobacteria bacterium]|nr:tetratricopeptide repeat protein [Alphaproteobacteria bacterium]